MTSVIVGVTFLVCLAVKEFLEYTKLAEERESKEAFNFSDVARNPSRVLGIGLKRLDNPRPLGWCLSNPSPFIVTFLILPGLANGREELARD